MRLSVKLQDLQHRSGFKSPNQISLSFISNTALVCSGKDSRRFERYEQQRFSLSGAVYSRDQSAGRRTEKLDDRKRCKC